MDVEWGLGVGWVIPGTIPLAQLRKEVTAGGGVTARFQVVEQGSFVLRVVRRKGKIDFILRRGRKQTRRGAFSAGVSLADPIRLNRLGPQRPAALRIVSDALSRPLIKKANQAFERALVRTSGDCPGCGKDSLEAPQRRASCRLVVPAPIGPIQTYLFPAVGR